MFSPRLKSGSLLGIETVALIDADHAGSRARRVTQDCLNGLQIEAKLLQACGDRSPQVVNAPIGDAEASSNRSLDWLQFDTGFAPVKTKSPKCGRLFNRA
jgi:hypothetical protein